MDTFSRRAQLADFLRTRRERLTPQQLGIPEGSRRRAKGLRREEVAELAGIGTTWYTWLEQGRDVRASGETLENLVQALRLDAEERRHLFMLARSHEPVPTELETERVSPALRAFIENQTLSPTYLLGRAWDILVWNQIATRTLGDVSNVLAAERNIVYNMFLNPEMRARLENWELHARHLVAQYRAHYDRYAGDPQVQARVDMLSHESAVFRRLWSEHEVRVNLDGVKRMHHPEVGLLELHHTSLSVVEEPDLRIVTYVAEPGSETEAKLQLLLADHMTL